MIFKILISNQYLSDFQYVNSAYWRSYALILFTNILYRSLFKFAEEGCSNDSK